MKIIFFLVLLINIIFFLWEFNIGDSHIQKEPKNESETKQILLLSELPRESQERIEVLASNEGSIESIDTNSENEFINSVDLAVQQQVELTQESSLVDYSWLIEEKILNNNESGEAEAVIQNKSLLKGSKGNSLEKTTFCYQVGPFLNEKLLTDWIAVNNINIDSVTQFNKETTKVTGYLVYYPQAKTYEESKQHVQLLESKGITEFWLFRKGELKGNISLGLFVKESRALGLKNKFIATGINVEVMTRYRIETEWYANVLSEFEIRSNMVKFKDKLSFVSSCDIHR